jgi:protoheme ferro-lyase
MRKNDTFVMQFTNNKKIKFRSHEAFSNAMEVISKNRFKNVAEMYDRVKQCPTGFEFGISERKTKEIQKKFNAIDFED